jgi:DNA (cytosine-5)-methyltransferase 1
VAGFYGDHARIIQRTICGRRIRTGATIPTVDRLRLVRELMGIDWMEWSESKQAIPPAYSEFIGRQVIQVLRNKSPSY